MITLKNITDCDHRIQELVLEWRNQPRIQAMMINKYIISIHEHADWLYHLRKKKKHIHYIVFDSGEPFGIAEIKDNDEFGIYIGDDNYLGKGYGLKLMNAFLEEVFKSRKSIWSLVLRENKGALKLYKNLGFTISETNGEKYYMIELRRRNK